MQSPRTRRRLNCFGLRSVTKDTIESILFKKSADNLPQPTNKSGLIGHAAKKLYEPPIRIGDQRNPSAGLSRVSMLR